MKRILKAGRVRVGSALVLTAVAVVFFVLILPPIAFGKKETKASPQHQIRMAGSGNGTVFNSFSPHVVAPYDWVTLYGNSLGDSDGRVQFKEKGGWTNSPSVDHSTGGQGFITAQVPADAIDGKIRIADSSSGKPFVYSNTKIRVQ